MFPTFDQATIDQAVAPFTNGSFVKSIGARIPFIGIVNFGDDPLSVTRAVGYIPGMYFNKYANNGVATAMASTQLELISEAAFNELRAQIPGS